MRFVSPNAEYSAVCLNRTYKACMIVPIVYYFFFFFFPPLSVVQRVSKMNDGNGAASEP